MSDAGLRAPFERLARMVEHELELIGDGKLDAFAEAVQERGVYLRSLPVPPPAAARATLIRVQALQSRVEIEAQRVRDELALARGQQAGARRAAKGYAGPPPALVSTNA